MARNGNFQIIVYYQEETFIEMMIGICGQQKVLGKFGIGPKDSLMMNCSDSMCLKQ